MANIRIACLLIIISFLTFQLGRSAPFSKDTFVVARPGGITEYAIDGSEIQTISLPAGYDCPTCIIHLDTSGTQLILPLIKGSAGDLTLYAYTLNANGENADITSMSSASPLREVVMSGQDVWFNYFDGIGYATRGSTSATTSNIVTKMNPMVWTIQVVENTLYAFYASGNFGAMTPAATTSQSDFLQILTSKTWFCIHNSAYYIMEGPNTLAKYVDSDQGLVKVYTGDTGLQAAQLTAMDIGGRTYILYLSSGNTYFFYMMDTGSNFGAPTKISSTGLYYSISPSPVATCTDNLKNQNETDIDCGGPNCGTCAAGSSCFFNSDCTSNVCESDICKATCTDNQKNQDETDVDCGGPNCSACALGKTCSQASDCQNNYCSPANMCAIPSCEDGWKNQNETDVDCGGGACSACTLGSTCDQDSDCTSNTCSNNVCVNAPVAVPVAEPVSAPVSAPIDPPQQSSPVSSPVSSTPSHKVSSGSSITPNFLSFFKEWMQL